MVEDFVTLKKLPGQSAGGNVAAEACLIGGQVLASEHPDYKNNKNLTCSFRILDRREKEKSSQLRVGFFLMSGDQELSSWDFWVEGSKSKSASRQRMGRALLDGKIATVTAMTFKPAVVAPLFNGQILGELHVEFEGNLNLSPQILQISATPLEVLSVEAKTDFLQGEHWYRAGALGQFPMPTGIFNLEKVPFNYAVSEDAQKHYIYEGYFNLESE